VRGHWHSASPVKATRYQATGHASGISVFNWDHAVEIMTCAMGTVQRAVAPGQAYG